MTYVIFFLAMSAVSLTIGMAISRMANRGIDIAFLENEYVANLLAVVLGTSFLGGLIGIIAKTQYTDFTFWTAVGLFALVQTVVYFISIFLFGRGVKAA